MYWFNIDEAISWEDELLIGFTTYFLDIFVGADKKIAEKCLNFLKEDGNIKQTGRRKSLSTLKEEGVPVAGFGVDLGLHSVVLDWVRDNCPELSPRQPRVGTRRLPREQKVKGSAVRQRTPSREAKGAPVIGQCVPIGELRLIPKHEKYLANSRLSARVWFKADDPVRALLNIFPHYAHFTWRVTKDDKDFDANWFGTGRIEYAIRLADPGTYRISVRVTSSRFKEGKSLVRESDPITVVTEQILQQELFEFAFVGPDPDLPFKRDASKRLLAKPGQCASSVQDEIDALNLQIAAVKEARSKGWVSDKDAKKYAGIFEKQIEGLEKIKKKVPEKPYIVRGIFLDRENSSSAKLRVLMYQTRKEKISGGRTAVDVVLYDFDPYSWRARTPRRAWRGGRQQRCRSLSRG